LQRVSSRSLSPSFPFSHGGQAYDLESKPWHQVLHILLQTNLPNLFPMALIAIFLYLQVT
jgi:hypothetical protein